MRRRSFSQRPTRRWPVPSCCQSCNLYHPGLNGYAWWWCARHFNRACVWIWCPDKVPKGAHLAPGRA